MDLYGHTFTSAAEKNRWKAAARKAKISLEEYVRMRSSGHFRCTGGGAAGKGPHWASDTERVRGQCYCSVCVPTRSHSRA